MKSGNNPVKVDEGKALTNVLDHAQSTHGAAPMQSVAHSIHLLEMRYPKEICEQAAIEMIKILEQKIVSDLPTDQQRHFFDYLNKLSNSKIKSEFHLVCAAVLDTDNNAFIEPEYDAEKNKVFRIDSLFNAINALRIEGRCDVGNRNNLLGSLNFIHRDISIIDDYTTFLISSAKDWLVKKWESTSSKEELFCSVVSYIQNTELTLSDDDRSSLMAYWKRNLQECGLNWDEADKLANGIADTFYLLPTPILPAYKNEMLALLYLDSYHSNVSPNNFPPYLNHHQELIKIAYIKAYKCRTLEDISTHGFTIFVNCLRLLETINPYLNLVGTEAELNLRDTASSIRDFLVKLLDTWNFDENDHHLVTSIDLNNQKIRLTAAINSVKDAQPYHDFIENVFAVWQNTISHYESEADNPFEILDSAVWVTLESLPVSAWQVTDSDIQRIFQSGESSDENLFIDVTPYQINRFILHALKTSPQGWSDMFTGSFKNLLGFLGQLEQQSEHATHALQLKVSSYPAQLINQLNYLLLLRENRDEISAIVESDLPTNWYIPCKIDDFTIAHLQQIQSNLTSIVHHITLTKSLILGLSYNKLNDIFTKFYSIGRPELANVGIIAYSIPKDRRIGFVKENSDRVVDYDTLLLILLALNESDRYEFSQGHTEKISDFDSFSTVIGFMPDSQKLNFANTYNHIISNFDEFLLVMPELPNPDRLAFANKHSDKFSDGNQLVKIVKLIPADKRLEFVNMYMANLNWQQLWKVIKYFPSADARVFIRRNINQLITGQFDWYGILDIFPISERREVTKALEDKIKCGAHVYCVLNRLADSDRFDFAKDNINKIDEARDLCIIISMLPDKKLEFAKKCASKIQTGYDLAYVLDCLPVSDRMVFVDENLSLIKDGTDLAYALKRLPELEILKFAKDNSSNVRLLFSIAIKIARSGYFATSSNNRLH